MNVANGDWRRPMCSSSSDFVNPSNNALASAEHGRRDDDGQLELNKRPDVGLGSSPQRKAEPNIAQTAQ